MFPAGEAAVLPSGKGVLPPFPLILADSQPVPMLGPTAELPLMAPELALAIYQKHAEQQAAKLASYSAVTVVRAELPDSAQQGEFELQRRFEAPHTLQFTPCITQAWVREEQCHYGSCRRKWITFRKMIHQAISLTNYKFRIVG
jgi:hypothetical protein